VFIADQMCPAHPGTGRTHGAGQIAPHIRRQPFAFLEQGFDFIGRHGIDQFAIALEDPAAVAQIDQLVGLDRHRHGLGHFFHLQVEDFAGRRRPFAVQEQDVAQAQLCIDPLGIDLAHLAGVLQVDPVQHANRLAGDEIAADHANPAVGHRRIRQALREQRLDFQIDAAHGVEHAIQRLRIGHAVAAVIARLDVLLAQLFLNLWPRAMHQDQADAQAGQQVHIVGQGLGKFAFGRLAPEGDDKGLAPEGVDIGRDRPEPGDEVLVVRGVAHCSLFFPSSFSAFSRRSQMVFSTLTRAKFLSFASTSVQGARPVEVRSTMSHTADTY